MFLNDLRRRFVQHGLSSNTLILAVTALLVLAANGAFYTEVLKVYALTASTALPLATLPLLLAGTSVLLLGVLCVGRATKPVLIIVLLLSSLAAYYMDRYGVVIDDQMLENIAQTNTAEARDLITPAMLFYFFVLGVVPAIILARIPLRWRGWRVELFARLKLFAAGLALVVTVVLLFGTFYASFFREHKPIRAYANPTYYIYSTFKYLNNHLVSRRDQPFVTIAPDAHIPASDIDRELIFIVVGETARADHFSLNGYPRVTNPLLAREKLTSFTHVSSCGTSTAVSVPCMFSELGSKNYDEPKAKNEDNLLDIIARAGTHVLWLDNNSDSKGVAVRVPYQSYRTPDTNPVCDDECRDEGMLARVQQTIDSHPTGDIVIVLHQMGNHGPAYYKRYPKAFEHFTPVCRSSDLSQCSNAEIVNAYDNAILYTDYFLARAIAILKQNDQKFETALLYMSDHGESLGEHGVYLHGLPRMIAPEAQTHVPAILWLGKHFEEVDAAALARKRAKEFTHDNLFHTVLGILEMQTGVYRAELDLLADVREPGVH